MTDDGSGIAPNILPHVFELFVQSETTRSRAEGGLSIGLTLVKQIVECHEGKAMVASEDGGRGSEFTVVLPLIQAPLLENAFEDAAAHTTNFIAHRFLVVDDNIDAANSVAELIRMWGHEVAIAYDGHAALEVARTFQPDVGLLDIGLPSMTGHELASRFRKVMPASLFLIALTGYGQPNDVKMAKEAGFNTHMVKPLDVGPLQTLLATSLRKD